MNPSDTPRTVTPVASRWAMLQGRGPAERAFPHRGSFPHLGMVAPPARPER